MSDSTAHAAWLDDDFVRLLRDRAGTGQRVAVLARMSGQWERVEKQFGSSNVVLFSFPGAGLVSRGEREEALDALSCDLAATGGRERIEALIAERGASGLRMAEHIARGMRERADRAPERLLLARVLRLEGGRDRLVEVELLLRPLIGGTADLHPVTEQEIHEELGRTYLVDMGSAGHTEKHLRRQ